MTDHERLTDIDEQLALLQAESKMLTVHAVSESGLLSVGRDYAKLRLKRIEKERAELLKQRERLEREVAEYWDSVLGKKGERR